MEAASTSGRSHGCTANCNLGRRGWRVPPARVLRLRTQACVEVGYKNREPVPLPKDYHPAVVPGFRSKPTPLLTPAQMVERLQRTLYGYGREHFGAFYSSVWGGIVTDPAMTLLPVDDQFVSKGHGVAEIVLLREGHLYMVDEHLARMQSQCEAVGITLPFTIPAIKRILLDTAAASGKLYGQLRFWITPGRGGFGPVQFADSEPALYVLCLADTYDINRTEAWDAITAPQPIHPTLTSTISGNQHLLNTVAQLKARQEGAQVAIFTDEEGFVQHGAGYTLVAITKTDVLVYPPNDNVTPSIMLEKALAMIPEERERSPDDVIVSSVVQRKLHISEVKAAREAFLICTPYIIAPIRSVDGDPIADNGTGVTSLALHYMLENDMDGPPTPGVLSARHTPVPYGYMTGMRSQLV